MSKVASRSKWTGCPPRAETMGEITLASGRKSDFYFNLKPTMLDPEGAALLAAPLPAESTLLRMYMTNMCSAERTRSARSVIGCTCDLKAATASSLAKSRYRRCSSMASADFVSMFASNRN